MGAGGRITLTHFRVGPDSAARRKLSAKPPRLPARRLLVEPLADLVLREERDLEDDGGVLDLCISF